MIMMKHKIFGLGEIVSKDVIDGHTYITAKFASGKELRLGLPESFQTGAVEALGTLKDEVDQAIAEKKARLVAATAPSTSTKKATAKTMPSGPIPSAFEKYLIGRGYKLEGDNGNRSTVYYYIDGVEIVLTEEGISWDTLHTIVHDLIPQYDAGGAKELIGAKQHRTVINSLKRFADFVGKP